MKSLQAISILIAACVVLVSLLVGPMGPLLLHSDSTLSNDEIRTIFLNLRLPRVLGGFFVGAGLAVCGLLYQSVFRSVLATPFTLGVSSGAAAASAFALVFGFSAIVPLPLAGGIGALLTVTLVVLCASRARADYGSTLLLCGIAASFFFSSLVLLFQYIGSMSQVFRLTRWMLGSLDLLTFDRMLILAVVTTIAAIIFLFRARALDLLVFGEEFSASRGLATRNLERELFCLSSIVIGVIVALAGPIGFIGVIVPTLLRLRFGTQHQLLIPLTFFAGGAFLVLCDALARSVAAPVEIPVGVITALIGSPFLIWIVATKQ